ncbi:MAG: S49 family peptidase [Pirellulales bacterium]
MGLSRQQRRAARRARELSAIARQPWAITPDGLDALRSRAGTRRLRRLKARREDRADSQLRPLRAGGVAVLRVSGVLVDKEDAACSWWGEISYEQIGAAFDRLLADSGVQTIVMAIDSPGGMVTGCQELADKIHAARSQKEIIGVADNMACSGGYWLLSACKTICAGPSAEVGSIGVYTIHAEDSARMAEYGIKETVIFAGQHKVDGNSSEPLSEQGRATIQERVDAAYTAFTSAVARNRGVSPDAVRAGYGQGKYLRGAQAIGEQLIDRVATLDQVLNGLGVTLTAQPAPQQISPYRIQASSLIPQVSSPVPAKGIAMDPKLRAALIARGLISATATDEQAQAVLSAFCAAHGLNAAAPAEQLAAQINPPAPAPVPAAAATDAARNNPAPATVPAADSQAAILAERHRVAELHARGNLLGIDAARIAAAQADGTTVAAALDQWTTVAVATERPAPRTIAAGQPSADKFAEQAILALAGRAPTIEAALSRSNAERPSLAQNSLAARSMVFMAAESLRIAGVRVDDMTGEEIATAALALGGEIALRGRRHGGRQLVAAGPVGRPSDFPNVLSALVGKMLDSAQELSPATYRAWCKRLDSVPDFKPKTINRVGEMGEFDYLPDNDIAEEAKPSEEVSWISTDRYAKRFGVTPRMVADDDLGALDDGARGLMDGHELTINRLALNLLTGNPTLPDGVALFDTATHKNKIAGGSGAVPSQTSLAAVRLKMRAQKGGSGLSSLNLSVAHILVAEAQESAVEQVLDPNKTGVVQYTADGSINTFRGRVGYSIEPMLTDWDSTGLNWFAFAELMRCAAIAYVFQTGYEGGRVRVYYDQERQTRWVECEGRVGVAVNNYRGAVWNVGS